MNPKQRGETSEAVILAELKKRGYTVSAPFGENARYDFIVDDGKQLKKVQAKRAWEDNGRVVFNTKSTTSNYTETEKEDIDSFMVYAPCLNSMFEIPIENATSSTMALRYVETGNGQEKNINWVDDYRL